MRKSTLILVVGHPASGKTTLARKLASTLRIPLLSKDDTIKEPLYETLETSGREWSFKIGIAAFRLMSNIIEEQLRCGNDMVVESTFKHGPDSELFAGWQEKYGFRAIQVVCDADAAVLAKRYIERIKSGQRHKGHGDENFTEESMLASLNENGSIKPLLIDGPVIHLDTNVFSEDATNEAIKRVSSLLLAKD